MRVVAGEWRGHRLAAPAGSATRPTADRVREALFSILGPVDDASVLDLFAGSGALGIEALSRGARSAVFADSSPAATAALRANLERLRVDASTWPSVTLPIDSRTAWRGNWGVRLHSYWRRKHGSCQRAPSEIRCSWTCRF